MSTAEPQSPDARREFRIVSRHTTDEEIAAVTAVLHGALDELAERMAARPAAGPSAWQRSQRSVRRELHPGPGAWRGFSG